MAEPDAPEAVDMDEAARGLAAGFDMAMAERATPSAPEPGLFGGVIADADGVGVRRGPGRPPGSRNRRSTEWRDYLLTRFRSPLLGMAELASAEPQALATVLGCTKLHAMAIIQTAQRDLAPYLHEKMPQSIAMPEGGGFQIVIQTGDAVVRDASTIEIQPIQQDQGVSAHDGARSEGAGSEA